MDGTAYYSKAVTSISSITLISCCTQQPNYLSNGMITFLSKKVDSVQELIVGDVLLSS